MAIKLDIACMVSFKAFVEQEILIQSSCCIIISLRMGLLAITRSPAMNLSCAIINCINYMDIA